MKNWLSRIFGTQERPPPAADAAAAGAAQSVRKRPGDGKAPQPDVSCALTDPYGADGGDDWRPGQLLLADFVVQRTLGEGGMGKVYLLLSRSTGSQFAVKRAKGLREADRRNFLAELQTWMDLPEHDNLVPCRFFRTLGGEVLIFAEYVEGGSLKDWIDSKKLYEGGSQVALERVLDVAIQLAWGLHCLHELGLIHQDVKPSNVLMGRDRNSAERGVKPRVTDYGIARARAVAGETFVTDPGRSILVSSAGGTPAYWSPEQAQGVPLTRKTDIWSWGVSVLEMFVREVTWTSGTEAAVALEQYVHQDAHEGASAAMPGGVADLLRECFRQDPAGRPTSLAGAVDRLKAIYRDLLGAGYSRVLDPIERAPAPQGVRERRHASGATWTDPQEWLQKALRAAGRDPAEAATMVGRRGMTRQGDLVAELALYAEAKRLYERLVRDGRTQLESDLATLCVEKALVHRTAADEHGASQEYDQAIAIWERLVNREGRRELANDLANTYTNKAVMVHAMGNNRGAVVLYDKAIATGERLVNQEGRRELANDLAKSYTNKANALSALGDNRGAVALYDHAIVIRERLLSQEGRRELANDLARTYMNKAATLSALGDNRGAVALYDQAIAIRERLVNQEGRRELANALALACQNKAVAISALGDNRGAVALYNQVIAIRERLVNQEGRRELAADLADTYENKALAVSHLGDHRAAVALYDQTVAIRERLVNQEGRRELANDLADTYMNKAIAVGALGDHRRAAALYDHAIAIRERLVNQEGRRELVGDLARLKAYRGNTLIALGEEAEGLLDMRSAQSVLEAEISRTGRADLKQVLTWLQQQLGTGVKP